MKDATTTHWTHGGTGVTNFQLDKLEVYKYCVYLHGDSDLFVLEETMYPYTWTGGSLHCKRRKDLSEFWELFKKIEKDF